MSDQPLDATLPQVEPHVVDRYVLCAPLARGGMATVYLGRLIGAAGFARVVAIKRLHPKFVRDPQFKSMLIDEARLATRIRHPNVVQPLDVVSSGDELLVVMDYVEGESLSSLLRRLAKRGERVPLPIASGILSGILAGLHAAHEAKSETGQRLDLVHRDISPQNVLVGVDGVARLIDFGIAKAVNKVRTSGTTQDGHVKGKIAYMAPEQLRGTTVDRRADLFAASVVSWELLTGKRLFSGTEMEIALSLLEDPIRPPRSVAPDLPQALDDVIMRGLAREPDARFASALEMASALEKVLPPPALAREIGAWIQDHATSALAQRAAVVTEIEALSLDELPTTIPRVIPSPSASAEAAPAESAPTTGDTVVGTTHQPVAKPGRSNFWIVLVAAVGVAGAGAIWLNARARPRPDPAAVATAPVASASEATPSIAPPPAPETASAPSIAVSASSSSQPEISKTPTKAARGDKTKIAPRPSASSTAPRVPFYSRD